MRVIAYLKDHLAAVAVILALLIGQAFCDLALPRYTSDIVDVGIQQSGVEHPAPEKMTADTHDAIRVLIAQNMTSIDDFERLAQAGVQPIAHLAEQAVGQLSVATGEQENVQAVDQAANQVVDQVSDPAFASSAAAADGGLAHDVDRAAAAADAGSAAADALALYDAAYVRTDGGVYELSDEGRAHWESLDEFVAVPLVVVDWMMKGRFSAVAADDASAGFAAGSQPPSDAFMAVESGIDEALVSQQAIAAAVAELARAGVDVARVQSDYLMRTGLVMMGFVALSVLIASIVGLIAARTGAEIGRSLRSRLFAKVVSFSEVDVQRFSAASLITRGTNDIQQIQMMTIIALRMVLYAPILAIGGVIMVARANISMSWIIAVGIAAVMAVVVVLMVVAMPKFKIMQKLIDKLNLIAREMLTGVSVVRAFGREAHEEARFDEANRDLMGTQLFTNRVMTFMMPTMMLIMNAISALVIWVGASYIDAGQIQTGDLIAFITYAMVIIMSFLIFGMLAVILPRADVAAGRINEVLDAKPAITDAKDAATIAFDASRGARIAFEHVDFKYGDSADCVLKDVTFVVEPGETCAIIGPTGSGKSTVVKLIERFYDVSSGAVTLDGVDVREIPQTQLRAQLGYVPQKAFLFSGTIESNVAYGLASPYGSQGESTGVSEQGNPPGDAPTAEQAIASDDAFTRGHASREAAAACDSSSPGREAGCPTASVAVGEGKGGQTREAVERALQIAQAADFVSERSCGLDAQISQGGGNVSGGQRQRLAIARALAVDARAYLFDDCFSALDYRTDARLRAALARQKKDATRIIVAQRVATIKDADNIVVLDEGRVVGQGTHDELIERCAAYREIALSQCATEESTGGAA